MVTCFSASPDKEAVILSVKGEQGEGISMGGQNTLCMTFTFTYSIHNPAVKPAYLSLLVWVNEFN